MSEGIPMGEKISGNNLRTDLSSAQNLNEGELSELSKLLADGYGELWQGDDNFRDAIIGNATQVLRIYDGNHLAAGLTIDNSRISAIAVNPDFQGQGLGVKLFEEASKADSNVWITVGVNPKSEAMIATLTSSKLKFMPVEDKGKIEHLFKQTNQGRNNYQVDVTNTEFPFLSQRLASKNIEQNTFLAYARTGSTHGIDYRQILFQNRS